MSDKVVAKGLAGVIAAQSRICFIDGQAGRLVYRGYDIHELAEKATFEDVLHLLWEGTPPTAADRRRLREDLAAHLDLPIEVVEILRTAARRASAMDALRTAVSALSLADPEADDDSLDATRRKAYRLQARIPLVVAAYHRIRSWTDPVRPDPSLGLAGNFLLALTGRRPDRYVQRIFDRCLILHAEHGFNASTFTARVVTSTRSDLYSAVTAAIGSLKGPLHGGANRAVMAMLRDIGSEAAADAYVDKLLAQRQRIMGFGHRVYKTEDPRATWLRRMSAELAERQRDRRWYDLSARIEQIVRDRKGLFCNVDFYSASVYTYLGIPDDLFTPIFAIARTAGWVAHVLEQATDRSIIRPRAEYIGPMDLTWPTL